jgi:uncharacterized membrane protein (DUF441 family)
MRFVDSAGQFLHKPDVWVALGIGVVATWVARPLLQLLRNTLAWGPKRLGHGLLGLLKEAANFQKASQDSTAAALYVGYNLSLLIVNVTFVLILLGAISTYQVADPGWRDSIHMWAAWIACLLGVVFSYAASKRVLLIALGYRVFFYPPKTVSPPAPQSPPAVNS